MTNNEKGKIQVVAPLPLQHRWDALQDSPKYKDKANYKLMEDMITAMELTVFGVDHPAYEQQLAEMDKCWTNLRNFALRLIEDAEKSEENAKKSVQNTLRVLEEQAAQIPELEKERDEYRSKYYDERSRVSSLENELKEAKARCAEAEIQMVNAQAQAGKLQAMLNHANGNILTQIQSFFEQHSADPAKVETSETAANDNAKTEETATPAAPADAENKPDASKDVADDNNEAAPPNPSKRARKKKA